MYGYCEHSAADRLRANGVQVEVKFGADGNIVSKVIRAKKPVGLRLLGAVDYLKGKGYTVA